MSDEPERLDDVINMGLDEDDGYRWVVLFDRGYDKFLYDAGDTLAFRVDCNQGVELLRLANKVVDSLAPEYAPDKEPIDAIIDTLEEVRDE